MTYCANSRASNTLREILKELGDRDVTRRVGSMIMDLKDGIKGIASIKDTPLRHRILVLWRDDFRTRAESLNGMNDTILTHLKCVISTIVRQEIRGYK